MGAAVGLATRKVERDPCGRRKVAASRVPKMTLSSLHKERGRRKMKMEREPSHGHLPRERMKQYFQITVAGDRDRERFAFAELG